MGLPGKVQCACRPQRTLHGDVDDVAARSSERTTGASGELINSFCPSALARPGNLTTCCNAFRSSGAARPLARWLPCFVGGAQPAITTIGRYIMSLGTILLIILILALVGDLPALPYSSSWGYYPTGGLGLLVLIVIILLVLGRI